jgi:hypothetical protein
VKKRFQSLPFKCNLQRYTVDVVGTTDRFNLFWLQLADVVGFQHLEYVPSNTHSGGALHVESS